MKLIFALLSLLSVLAAGENLIEGSFSGARADDKKAPAGWSKPDHITSIWKDQQLLLKTSVLQVDKKKFEKIPEDYTPDKGGKYETVGAHEGAWLFSRPVKLNAKDKYFILEADIKGPKSVSIFFPKIFLRGYQIVTEKDAGKHSSYFHKHFADLPEFSEQFGKDKEQHRPSKTGEHLMVWRSTLYCRLAEDQKWQHFKQAYKMPGMKRYRPEVVLIKPYAYWPLGDYHFDNIVFRRCTKAEYMEAKKKGHK